MSLLSRTRKRRRESKPAVVVVVTSFLVLAVIAVISLAMARSPEGLPLVHYRTLYASVPDPGNLLPHNEVRIHGIRVGQVLKVSSKNGRSLIPIKLDPGTPALPLGTKPVVRAKGLLGQRYLELVPGKSRRTLPDGATIVGGPHSLSYGVPDALDTFDAQTRGRLGEMLRGLGRGTLGRGADLNSALHAGPPAGRQFKRLIATVLAREGAAARFVPSVKLAAQAVDSARDDIARGFSDASAALRPINARRRSLQAILDEAPPTLRVAAPALDEGRRLLAATRSLATAASETLPAAPPGLRATTALLRDSRAPLRRADPLVRSLRPTVPAVLRITRAASPVLSPLRRALDQLTPIAHVLGQYGCAIDNFAENWRSALGYGVPLPNGGTMLPSGRIGGLGTFRITAVAKPSALQGVGPKDPTLLGHREPYPKPCEYSPGPTFPLGNPTGGGLLP